MTYLICYDIESDKLRKKISDRLEAEGLLRIQYSVFLGPMETPSVEQFTDWAEQILGKYPGEGESLICINLSKINPKKFHILGSKVFDLEQILGLEHTLFL